MVCTLKLYLWIFLFIIEILDYEIFLDYDWPWVIETMENETANNEG